MRKQTLIAAVVGLMALGLAGAPQAIHAQEQARVVAPTAVTLRLADLPAGDYLGSTLDFGTPDIEAERFTRIEGDGPEIILSMIVHGAFLAPDTDSRALIEEFRGGFEGESGLRMRDITTLDVADLGERALLYHFRFQDAAAGRTTVASAGHGGLVIFSRGEIAAYLLILDSQPVSTQDLEHYAAIVDVRMADAVTRTNLGS
jgi:hypothetical protein